ncbi:MAG: tRNA (guanosine(37)-N1)-methyltransferase TrmD [Chloroflexi bacterium]|nr:tRNA (guanosine(37)-N1)-methyltransferase TrmD [Chloroflexota bacterium]
MRFDIFTLFPEIFGGVFDESILKRARENKLLEIALHDIRDYTTDKHHVTDDYPYAGGGGMVMKAEPILAAVESVLEVESWKLEVGSAAEAEKDSIQRPTTNIQSPTSNIQLPIILMTPQGRVFTQAIARELAQQPRIALICGHYEGVDERVRQHLVTDEISIGDYVLTGGEIPAMVVVDAVTRLIPGVLGDPAAPNKDSHATGLLEGPHYTRPADFRGWKAPDVLLSGNHAEITKWRRRESLRRTFERRPDLLDKAELSEDDLKFLRSLRNDAK